ncbi:hypothetical protein MBLNU457_4358t1 [Dothideomycetes sp. NU457]
MGVFSHEEKGYVEETAKWAYITLDDFHPRSSWTPITYAWLWFMSLIGVAVFAADTFTAVNLLAFDKWSSKVEPAIPLKYSKWIFAVCIMISYVLYAYEYIRAIRVMRRGAVAESYLDPLAVQWQSMRPKGWKRFLVFTELTNSRKGADYVALFTYFQFKSAVRIIFAEAGRQVVNAITLYSVMEANFIPTGAHAAEGNTSPVLQFFLNIKELYLEDKQQAIVLLSMLFTLVIFVFSALSLLTAVIFFITFLWHYIPQHDGRLSIYCKRKIDKRLEKIVESKVKAAIEDQERKRKKEEARAAKRQDKSDQKPKLKHQPTLPDLGDFANEKDAFPLVRQDTASTLPLYSSRPPTREEIRTPPAALTRQPTLPNVGLSQDRPGMPYRSDTQSSAMSGYSYASNAPLLSNADDMGYESNRSESPDSGFSRPALHHMTSSSSFRSHGLPRSNTQSSLGSQQSYGPPRPGIPRSNTQNSFGSQHSYGPPPPAMRPPMRSDTTFSFDHDQMVPSRTGTVVSGPGAFGPPPPAIQAPKRSYTAPIQEPDHNPFARSNSAQGPRRLLAPPIRAFTPVSTITERSERSTPDLYRQNSSVSAYSASIYSQAPPRFPSGAATERSISPPFSPVDRPYIAFNPGNIRSNTAPPKMPGAYHDLLDDY